LQLKQAFKDERDSQDGAQNQRPNGPTCGLYDGQQNNSFLMDNGRKRLRLWTMDMHTQRSLRCTLKGALFSVDNFVKNLLGNACLNT
jgi:hypothetical protein